MQIELRVADTSIFLSDMVGLKMIGAEAAAADHLQRLRETELEYFKKPRQLYIVTGVAGTSNTSERLHDILTT